MPQKLKTPINYRYSWPRMCATCKYFTDIWRNPIDGDVWDWYCMRAPEEVGGEWIEIFDFVCDRYKRAKTE